MVKRVNKIKMIVSDLDGTLLNSKSELSSKTRNILIEKSKHGKKIVIATGRPLASCKYALKDFSFADYIVVSQGSAIYDVKKEYFLWQDTFFIETAIQIFQTYQAKCSVINICSSNYFYQYTESFKINPDPAVIRVKDFSDLASKNIPVCVMDLYVKNGEDAKVLVEEINHDFPLLEAFIMKSSSGDHQWVDVVKRGVNKANATTIVQDMCGIYSSETVVFGDGVNDIEMLQNNGFGVAMENADVEAKKVCKEVTVSNDENGVVKWLDQNDV